MRIDTFRVLQRLTIDHNNDHFVRVHELLPRIQDILKHASQFQYDTGGLARGGLQTTVSMLEKLEDELIKGSTK